jgi:hypothetical protein
LDRPADEAPKNLMSIPKAVQIMSPKADRAVSAAKTWYDSTAKSWVWSGLGLVPLRLRCLSHSILVVAHAPVELGSTLVALKNTVSTGLLIPFWPTSVLAGGIKEAMSELR